MGGSIKSMNNKEKGVYEVDILQGVKIHVLTL